MIESVKRGSYRTVHLGHIEDLSDWPINLPLRANHFVLFLAMDASSVALDAVQEAARRALQAGMVYLCAWGPDCKRIHDLFDEQIWAQGLESSEADVLLTTWHARDSLEDAVRFFLNTAWPADEYLSSTRDWYALVVGDSQLRSRVLSCLDQTHLKVDEEPWA